MWFYVNYHAETKRGWLENTISIDAFSSYKHPFNYSSLAIFHYHVWLPEGTWFRIRAQNKARKPAKVKVEGATFFLTSNVGMQLVRNPDNYITHENVTTQQNAYLAVLSSNSDISSKTCSQMVNTQRNPALALDLFKLLSLQNQGTSFIPIGQTNTFRLDFQPVTLTCCSLSQAASNWLYVRSHVEQHTDITQLD